MRCGGDGGVGGQEAPRGGYRVLVRVRPPTSREAAERSSVVEILGEDKLRVARADQGPLVLKFDRVFGQNSRQAEVFAALQDVVSTAVEGRSSTILAYGQTGSGKTHTMAGELHDSDNPDLLRSGMRGEQRGVIPRALEYLFYYTAPRADSSGRTTFWRTYVSFIEIYNEKLHDLLKGTKVTRVTGVREVGPSKWDSMRKASDPSERSLEIREGREGVVSVPGATVVEVGGANQAFEVLKIGSVSRTSGDNGVNRTSSRSHAVFQVTLEKRIGNTKSATLLTTTKLSFVDLAGSEKLPPSAAVNGGVLHEVAFINHSLSSLGQCIAALVDIRRTHVPCRNSKLTRLLQDSLRGASLTAMCITISPSSSSLDETLSSLKFADRAKRAVLEQRQPPPPGEPTGAAAGGSGGGRKQVEELRSQVTLLSAELHVERAERRRLQELLEERAPRVDEEEKPAGGSPPRGGGGGAPAPGSGGGGGGLEGRSTSCGSQTSDTSRGTAELGASPSSPSIDAHAKPRITDASRSDNVVKQPSLWGIAELIAAEEKADELQAKACMLQSLSAGNPVRHHEGRGRSAHKEDVNHRSAIAWEDIASRVSMLAHQNEEVLSRLEALESRSVSPVRRFPALSQQLGVTELPTAGASLWPDGDDRKRVPRRTRENTRWRRAAVQRLRVAASDPEVPAGVFRRLIGEAFSQPDSSGSDAMEPVGAGQTYKLKPMLHPKPEPSPQQSHMQLHGQTHHPYAFHKSPVIHEFSLGGCSMEAEPVASVGRTSMATDELRTDMSCMSSGSRSGGGAGLLDGSSAQSFVMASPEKPAIMSPLWTPRAPSDDDRGCDDAAASVLDTMSTDARLGKQKGNASERRRHSDASMSTQDAAKRFSKAATAVVRKNPQQRGHRAKAPISPTPAVSAPILLKPKPSSTPPCAGRANALVAPSSPVSQLREPDTAEERTNVPAEWPRKDLLRRGREDRALRRQRASPGLSGGSASGDTRSVSPLTDLENFALGRLP